MSPSCQPRRRRKGSPRKSSTRKPSAPLCASSTAYRGLKDTEGGEGKEDEEEEEENEEEEDREEGGGEKEEKEEEEERKEEGARRT